MRPEKQGDTVEHLMAPALRRREDAPMWLLASLVRVMPGPRGDSMDSL
jgi:hypothetical protein